MSSLDTVLNQLKSEANPENIAGMARFGIATGRALGISVTRLRQIGKNYKNDHELALELWRSGYHEARILAAIIDDPLQVTPAQMDAWIEDFDSWDLCDQTCSLFDKTPYAVTKIKQWVKLKGEFQRRAGYALLAEYAWHSKTETDATFISLLPLIVEGSEDERNYVKKAVNWALREIGKRNLNLHKEVLVVAEKLATSSNKTARWIAKDALRELKLEKIVNKAKARN